MLPYQDIDVLFQDVTKMEAGMNPGELQEKEHTEGRPGHEEDRGGHHGDGRGDHGRGHDHDVVVKVDGHPHHVSAGTYKVSAFKTLVGVAADRELDILSGGTFQPLDDNADINIHGHETFVSHVRTGGSS
jgi:hypothetical protein